MDLTRQVRFVNFRLLYLVTQLVGVVLILLVASWILIHLDGFGYDTNQVKILINWHPFCMSFGMVFLYGNCKLKTDLSHFIDILLRVVYFLLSYSYLSWISIRAKKVVENYTRVHSWIGFYVYRFRAGCRF